MKIKIDRHSLLSQLAHISKAIPIKTPLSILTGIKFVVKEEGLYLTSSDSDITINTFLPLEIEDRQVIAIEEIGSIIIPGKYFIEIIRKLSADMIEISTFEDNSILIKGARGEYTLNGFDASLYPNIELIKNDHHFHIETPVLKTIIRQTAFSAATNESRPALTGVNFRYDEGSLECTATDSFRLSRKIIPLTKTLKPFNIIIPSRSLSELSKILDDSHQSVTVYLSNNQILFQTGGKNPNTAEKEKHQSYLAFQSRLLDGIFPDLADVIPSTFGIKIKANYQELYQAFDRAALIDSNIVKLNILPEEKKIFIKAHLPEIGKIEEDIGIELLEGSELRIACSAVFMIDALKSINNPSADITLGFNGEMKPFILQEVNDETMIQLIVPVNIPE